MARMMSSIKDGVKFVTDGNRRPVCYCMDHWPLSAASHKTQRAREKREWSISP